MRFNQPLFAGWAIAAFLLLLFFRMMFHRHQRGFLQRFGSWETLKKFSFLGWKRWGSLLLAASVALAFLAAAEPAAPYGSDWTGRTLNAVIVLDVSRSMLAEDTPTGQSRSELARAAVQQLWDAYPQGYFSLITVAKSPQSYALTGDHQALSILLAYNGDPYRARDEGSDLPAGLTAAAQLIKDSPIPVEIVFLVTDGGDLKTGMTFYRQVIREFRKQGVRVVAIGVGETDPVPIPARNPDGSLEGYYSTRGALALTFRNDLPLYYLADETGGFYQVIREDNDLVEVVQSHNLANQPVLQGGEVSLAYIPLLASLFFLILFLLNSSRRTKG
ncbi:MAG: vWA domain-containing protein [Patescibacteria group bacterium]